MGTRAEIRVQKKVEEVCEMECRGGEWHVYCAEFSLPKIWVGTPGRCLSRNSLSRSKISGSRELSKVIERNFTADSQTLGEMERVISVSKMKSKALKECDHMIAKFADCAKGRTLSVVWTCRSQSRDLNNCLHQYTNDEVLAEYKRQYLAEKEP